MGHRRLGRKLLSAGALALLLPALALSVWWWWAADALEQGLSDWIEARRAEGMLVKHQGLRVDGFPFSLRATIEAPHLAARGFEWQGSRLIAAAPAWDYRRITLTLPGEQRASLVQAGLLPLDLTTRSGGQGSAELTLDGRPLALQLGFTELTAQAGAAPTTIASLDLALAQPPLPPAGHRETGLTLALSARGVTLPEGSADPLDRAIARLDAALRVQGRPPRLDPPSLSAWSREGGTVELDRLLLEWEPASMLLNGTLALDGALQPQAAMSAELRGAEAVVTALKPRLKPNQVNLARTVVAMLSRPGADGRPVIQAPVTVQDGGLFLGPLKLLAMPRLAW